MIAIAFNITGENTIGFAVGGTAVLGFWVMFTKHIGRPVFRRVSATTWLVKMQEQLNTIVKEVTHDSGHSIKDAIVDTRQEVKGILEKLETHGESTVQAARLAEIAVSKADGLSRKVDDVMGRVGKVEQYLHDYRHDLGQKLQPVLGAAHVTLAQENERQSAIRSQDKEAAG